MSQIIDAIEKENIKDRPEFNSGDTISVDVKIQEGSKERIQTFQGVVIKRRGSGLGATFTVRKISQQIAVERIFPLHSPHISSITVERKGKVRRAKLYYLRNLVGKAARIKEAK